MEENTKYFIEARAGRRWIRTFGYFNSLYEAEQFGLWNYNVDGHKGIFRIVDSEDKVLFEQID